MTGNRELSSMGHRLAGGRSLVVYLRAQFWALAFIIYINDLDLGLVSKISKFADDTKMGINADSDAAVKQLQEDQRKVGEWSKKWQMLFNLDKCKIMHIVTRTKMKNMNY